MNNTKLLVSLNRKDVYRQLLAMCEDSRIFSVRIFPDGFEEKDLELLTVADRIAVTEQPDIQLQYKIIGYIRLMPQDDNTLIVFRQENHPLWHDIPVVNPALWDNFVKTFFEYFSEEESEKIIMDAIEKAAEAINKFHQRIENNSSTKLIWERLNRLHKSDNPIDRVIADSVPVAPFSYLSEAGERLSNELGKQLVDAPPIADRQRQDEKGEENDDLVT
jgi:hypothetical protein